MLNVGTAGIWIFEFIYFYCKKNILVNIEALNKRLFLDNIKYCIISCFLIITITIIFFSVSICFKNKKTKQIISEYIYRYRSVNTVFYFIFHIVDRKQNISFISYRQVNYLQIASRI